MKKFTLGILVGAGLMLTSSVFAESGLQKIEAYLRNDLPITVDGESVQINSPKIIYDGTTYLPLRETASLMGGSVSWNEATQTVQILSSTSPTSKSEVLPTEGVQSLETTENAGTVTKTTFHELRAINVNGNLYFSMTDFMNEHRSEWEVKMVESNGRPNYEITKKDGSVKKTVDTSIKDVFYVYEEVAYVSVSLYPLN